MAGDAKAQRQLFEREKRQVTSKLSRILGRREPVDDLVQEVFCSVFRDLRHFRGESSLSTWIDRIVVRTAFAQIRKRRARDHVELEAENVAADDPSAERAAAAREAARRVGRALETLGPEQGTAFALHVFDGHSVGQVARLMQCSVVATKARIWRARRLLRQRASRDPALADYVTPAALSRDSAQNEAPGEAR